uniref:Uncharacterized protein n=1 Tax=Panagrolaimus sp. JU765 TaxID=591449 RepID=A0AC34R7P2_9BILA
MDSEIELITDPFIKFEMIPEYLTKLQVLNYCKLRFEIVDDDENRKYTKILSILSKTLEFVQKIHLEFEILHKNESNFVIRLLKNLKNCNSLDWSVLYPGEKIPCLDLIEALPKTSKIVLYPGEKIPCLDLIEALPKTSKIGLMGFTDADDGFLDQLAGKTDETNPIINLYLSSQKYFTLNGIQNFLEKATFGKKARITIFPLDFQRIPFLRMLSNLGKIVQNQNISFVDFYFKGSIITFCLQQQV